VRLRFSDSVAEAKKIIDGVVNEKEYELFEINRVTNGYC